jgi:hypothetical protein
MAMWFGQELERNYQAGIGNKGDTLESHLQWFLN